jgi:hypothetical protein
MRESGCARRRELPRVTYRPKILLHSNGSANDNRACVTGRKISGGARSEAGRDRRDAFLRMTKTGAKLGDRFRDHLGHRLTVAGASLMPALPDPVRWRAAA